MGTIIVDPVTRLEGHLKVEMDVDHKNRVTEARSQGLCFAVLRKY